MDAGPSSSRRASHSMSPTSRHKHLRSTDALSPELPPTYNSLDTHFRQSTDDRDRLLGNGKGKRRSDEEEEEEDGDDAEIDALRLDLEDPDGDTGADGHGTRSAEEEAIRIASLDQRKALWWKNTLITGLFICSWYVLLLHPCGLRSSLVTRLTIE